MGTLDGFIVKIEESDRNYEANESFKKVRMVNNVRETREEMKDTGLIEDQR